MYLIKFNLFEYYSVWWKTEQGHVKLNSRAIGVLLSCQAELYRNTQDFIDISVKGMVFWETISNIITCDYKVVTISRVGTWIVIVIADIYLSGLISMKKSLEIFIFSVNLNVCTCKRM